MAQTILPILEAYTLTLSAPIKPGAIHRFITSSEYEIRLVEMVSVIPFLEEAFSRGEALARGSIDARMLGLGAITGKAMVSAYERTEVRPLSGLIASMIAASAAYGYYRGLDKISPPEALRRIAKYLYSSPPEDSIALIRALEAVAERDLILLLDRNRITPSRIELEGIRLGDVYEVLSAIDKGFSINLRGINNIIELRSEIANSSNIVEGIVRAFIRLLPPKFKPVRLDPKELLRIDRSLTDRRFTRLLGPVGAATALVLFSEPPTLPRPS
ncbi:MAG: hypothetical protein F7C34_04075 [Desulfurococcales archaeon]|nr:hypothetical protein [Desulfurococcales archaeon]